jgi:hypothetical protein
MSSRPLYHAEEEIYGVGSPSVDFVKFKKFAPKNELRQKAPGLYFLSLTFSIHPKLFLGLYVMLKKEIFGPGSPSRLNRLVQNFASKHESYSLNRF